MSGLEEPILFGLTFTQLLPVIIALSTITTLLIGVFKFLMRHVTKEAVAVRKEMTDKLTMHEKNLNQNSDRIVDRQKEIQSMIELLNTRITEIKKDVNATVSGVKMEIRGIEEEVGKRLEYKQTEITKIQLEIDRLRIEFQKLEVEQARRMGRAEDKANRSEERANRSEERADIAEKKSKTAESRAKHADSRLEQHMIPDENGEGRPHGGADEVDEAGNK